jgi:uncharacterized repeat protein (TIGR01451 family)
MSMTDGRNTMGGASARGKRVGTHLAIAFGVIAGLATSQTAAAVRDDGSAQSNPNFASSCGTNVVVILDESGSIIGFEGDVQNATSALVNGLNSTGSKMRLVEFSTNARDSVVGGTAAFQTVNSTFATQVTTYFTGTGSPQTATSYNPRQNAGDEFYTNWEAGLQEAARPVTDSGVANPAADGTPLVVFITDGDPNTVGTAGTSSPNNGGGNDASRDAAIQEIARLQAAGSHVLSIAVGAAATSNASYARLTNLTEPGTFEQWVTGDPPAGLDLRTVDALRVVNFADLDDAIASVVYSLCGSSLTINKVDDAGNPITARNFTTTVQSLSGGSGLEWEVPNTSPTLATAPSSRTVATNVAGTANFKWTPGSLAGPQPWNSTIRFSEALPTAWAAGNAACTRNGANSFTLTPTVTDGIATYASAGLAVNRADAIVCTVTNTRPATITIVKDATGLAPNPATDFGFTATSPAGALNPIPSFLLDDDADPTLADTRSFTVSPGSYSVSENDPAPLFWELSGITCGDTTGSASATIDVSNRKATINVAAGSAITCRFANSELPAVIGDRVWDDSDGDGIQDAGEAGISGVTVTLIDATTAATIATTTTGAGGSYSFGNLIAGAYKVVFGNTAGGTTYLYAPANQGADDGLDSDASQANGTTGVITVAPGQHDLSVDAGLARPATVTGTVTQDITNDGTGDLPLHGVTLRLFADANTDGAPDGLTPVATTTSASDGTYTFSNLLPGNYVVVETNPASYIDVADFDTTPDGDPRDADTTVDSRVAVRLLEAETDTGNSFVDQLPAAIQVVKTAGTAADGATYTATGTVGESVTYTFVVTNTGQAPLSAVTLSDPLPRLTAITCTGGTNGSLALAAGQSISCSASYVLDQADIDAGVVNNLATVKAERPGGSLGNPADDVTDTDAARVSVPRRPAIGVVKKTNGVDHATAPGAVVRQGTTVTWTYTVTNPGNVALGSVVVRDDAGTPANTADDLTPSFVSGDANGNNRLDVGETWSYQATGTATTGQYGNVGSATGNPVTSNGTDLPGLTDPTDTDTDFYFGVRSTIDIQKTVASGAGVDCSGSADVESVSGASGSAVTYCFVVTNTGNVPLSNVTVSDAAIGLPVTVVAPSLAAGASVTYSFGDTIAGDLVNTASATGTPVDNVSNPGSPVPFPSAVVPAPVDTDTASVDETPTFSVVKTNDANGDGVYSDAEAQTATPATEPFRVTFTNNGVDPVTFVGLTDSVGGTSRTINFTCHTGPTSVAAGASIAAGQVVVCDFAALVDLRTVGQEVDVVTVRLADDEGNTVPVSDDSTVRSPQRSAIGGVVYNDVNGNNDQDAGEPGLVGSIVTITPPAGIDAGDGPGNPVTIPVADGTTVDRDGVPGPDPAGSYYLGNLLPGDYQVVVTTLPAQYQQFEDPDAVRDNATTVSLPAGTFDLANDFGYARPSLDIEKASNGQDADLPTGPFAVTGSTVTWTYVVTNTGHVAVSNVTVTDVPAPNPAPAYVSGDADTDSVLDPGEVWTYQASGTATDGQFRNDASAAGTWLDSTGTPRRQTFDTDSSHYYGVRSTIDIQKTVALGAGVDCGGSADVDSVSGVSGTPITYCFVVTNTGNVPLTGVTISDVTIGLPATIVAATLAPGASATFARNAVIAGDLVNTATATGTPQNNITDPGNPTPFPPSVLPKPIHTDTAAVDETPTFTVVKSNDADGDGTYSDTEAAQAAVSTVPFRVVVANIGVDPVTFTSIADSVGGAPRSFTDLVCTLAPTGAAIAPTAGVIPGGGVVTCTFTAQVDITLAGTETDAITVVLSDDDGHSTPHGDQSTVNGAAAVSIAKQFVSASDADGDHVFTVVYDVVVSNDGTTSGTYNLSDTPAFDADLSVVSGTATVVTDGANHPAAPGAFSAPAWTLATGQLVGPGETHTYTLTFAVDAEAVVADPTVLSPCVATPGSTGNGLFNAATLTVDGEDLPAQACGDLPLLSIDKHGPTLAGDLDHDGEIDLGDTLGYTIVVSNIGTTPLTGVTVTDTIIPDVSCERADTSPFDHVAGDDLGIGETITCTGTYVVVANDVIAGKVANTATADSDETPPVDDSVTGPIPPAVTITKSATAPVSLGGGQYRITYSIVVGNTGSAGTYHLDDALQFGDGIIVDSATVTNTVPGTITPNAGWNGAGDVVVVAAAAPAAIGYNATHVYVVTVVATVDPTVAIPTGVVCPPPGSGQNGGFGNTATVAMDDDVVSDDACVQPPEPDVDIAKRVTSGPVLESDGTYTVVYDITVRNMSSGVGLYDLTDSLQFGGGITVLGATIQNVTPGLITTLGTWNGTSATLAVDDAPITAGAIHTYRVTVHADAVALTTPAAGQCSTGEPPTPGGFLNVATVTSGADTASADDCVAVPLPGLSVTKLVDPTSPKANADGTYEIRYAINVVNNQEGPGRYTLTDDLGFGDGINVLDASVSSTEVAADLSGWSGSGVIASDVAITGLATHTFTVVVTAGVAPTVLTGARDCTLGTDETGTGFLNVTDLLVGGQVASSDDACVPAPAPAIVVTKDVAPDGFVQHTDGTYSITYLVRVTNTGGAAGQYELDDALSFGAGITIDSATVTGTTPASLTTNPGWDGLTDVDVTTAPVAIDGTDKAAGVRQHVYTVVVTGSAAGLASTTAGDCTLDAGENGTGYLNTAVLTVEGATSYDDACDLNPNPAVTVVKDLVAGPTLTVDGTYALQYRVVVTNTGGLGSYDLSDAVAFGGGITVVPGSASVSVTSPANGSIEAGAGWVGDAWNGVGSTTITTDQSIAAGASHVYLVTLRAAVDPVGFDRATDGTCPPPNQGGTGGFLNVATVTSADHTVSDDACGSTPAAALTLSKQIVSGPVDLGDGTYRVVYDVVVTNTGDGPDAYMLDDQLRFGAGITILSASVTNLAPGTIMTSAAWNGGADTRVVTDQPIAGKASHTYQVTVTVDALTVVSVDAAACSTGETLQPGGLLNVALIDSSSTTTTADDCGDVQTPNITITKVVRTGPVERAATPGVYDITYDVVVDNAGPGSGRYDLADDLAYGDGITVLSATVTSTDVPADLTGWTGSGTIVANQAIAADIAHRYTVRVTARVAPGTLPAARDCTAAPGEEGTGLLNVAGLSGPLVTPANAPACAPVPEPAIAVAKSVVSGPTLVSGTTYDITYRLVVTNAGTGIGQYDLDDALHIGAGVTVVSAAVTSTDANVSGTAWNGTSTVRVISGAAIPGTSAHTYTVTVRVSVAPGIAPPARDCISGEGENGTGLLNTVTVTVPGVQVPATGAACGEVPNPNLHVVKSVASGPTRNSDGTYTVSYTVVATNTGAGPGSYDLVDVPSFGPAISIVSASAASDSVTLPSPQIWNPASGAPLVARDVAIAAGQTHTYTMTFVVAIDGPVLKTTAGTCTDGHTANESEFFNQVDVMVDDRVAASDDACVPPPIPNLQLTKSVSPEALTYHADGTYDVVYTLTVSNLGSGPTSYTLTDTFAFGSGVEVLAAAVTGKPATATLIAGFDGATNTRVATAPLPGVTTHTYSIAVRVRVTRITDEQAFDCTLQPGETGTGLLNRAQVNPTAEACVAIPKFADLELSKVVSAPTVDVGQNVTFTVYLTNRGPAATSGVSVRDLLPAGLTYVSHNGAGSYDRTTGIWTIGNLAVGQIVTLDVTVRVTGEAAVANIAEVWSSGLPDPDSTPANGDPNEDDQGSATVTGKTIVIVEPPAPPPATLPPTGGSTHTPVTAAAWLVLVGLVMVAWAARRRRPLA